MAAHEQTLKNLQESGHEMMQGAHYASDTIRVRLFFSYISAFTKLFHYSSQFV